jgi:alpha-N-acetylglucosaminidase
MAILVLPDHFPILTAFSYHPVVHEEEVPSSNSIAYLAEVGKAVYGAIAAVDPDAVWLVQGWTLHEEKASFWQPPQTKAFLTSGHTVVLDFFVEGDPGWIKMEGFYGVTWIWCMFRDGGQNYVFYGMTDSIIANPVVAAAANSTMVGVGLVPEGYEANPAIFEMFSEVAFMPKQLVSVQWFEYWARRRYNWPPPAAVEAWRLLYTSGVYNICNNSHENHNTDFTISRPRLYTTLCPPDRRPGTAASPPRTPTAAPAPSAPPASARSPAPPL